MPGFLSSANPMIRSGLLFAGANRYWRGERNTDSGNDGILTAEEVSMMDLSGVELATLSACETGLGEIRNYEGLYGFQRAFRIAGARNLVMTLWRVPDNTTRLFMETFYANMVKRHSVREAFEAAVNDIRIKYPAPYYWAGYVLVDGRR
jgi:CHAT domain-containing protein